MKINIIRAILIILLLITFGIIFMFSNEPSKQSSKTSRNFSKMILDLTNKNESKKTRKKKIKAIQPVIRKLAHFSIYMLTGTLLMALAYTYNFKFRNKIIFSLVIGFIYACSDEIHQLFIDRQKWRSNGCIYRYYGSFCRSGNLHFVLEYISQY